MGPNLETFKNISNRITRFRHHRNQEITDDNNHISKKSSQNPNQASASATTSLAANQVQSKKGLGAFPPPHTPSAMPSTQGHTLSQPSKSSPMAANNPAPPNMASSSLFPGPSNAFLVAKTSFGENLHKSTSKGHGMHSNDQKGNLGSRFNPIDLTDTSTTHSTYNPFQFPDYSESSTGSFGTTKPIHPTPLWSSSFQANPFLPPPLNPTTPSTQEKSHPGSPWEFINQLPDNLVPPPVSDFPSASELLALPMTDNWFMQTPQFGSYLQPPGQAIGQSTSADKMPAQHMGVPWGWAGHNAAFPIPSTELSKEPGADKMVIDVESPGNSSESSADLEQFPEDNVAVNLALKELEPLQEFVRGCLGQTCSRCSRNIKNKPKPMEPNDVVKMTTGWTKAGGKVLLGVSCQNVFCTVSTCLGCGRAVSSVATNGSNAELYISGTRITVRWCCDAGRLAAIWALACGWDAPSWKSRTVTRVVGKVRERTNAKSAVAQNSLVPSNSQANARGVGYGGGGRLEYFPFPYLGRSHTRPTPKKPVDVQEYLLHEAYFRLVAVLLPSYTRASPLDVSPPTFLAHMLSRSPLIEKAATMLSNDSIGEIARQYQVHDAVLDLFHTLGSHPVTADLVYNDRNLYHPKGGSLLEVSVGPMKSKSRIVAKDTGKSLLALLDKLAAQSLTVLRHAKTNRAEFQNGEGKNLLNISQRISQLCTEHEANMQRLRTTMEISEDKPEVNFAEWHRENCVSDVEDEILMQDFACAREAGRAVNTIPARGRMKRLITELSTLKTSLPEGIFICHGSSRLDIMKVLIIGPKHTPYEHGLFEFDLYCPLEYPNSPPLMKFKTTNSGKIRFNPNLYEDGKICLSLLGTWAGEPWRADQSTILQVLVSIQSMILCEQPWYNEPGREELENKTQSTKYNNEVRTWTMKYALLPWINAVGAKDRVQDGDTSAAVTSVWQETARLYLQANAKEIMHSSKQASSKSKKSALQTTATLIGTALQTQEYLY
ncbi:uncharacterized protein GGS22DRAFT_103269 [Annulohypoxylon maeteangense]|uniref:uncharacterized protein n=1 Tax=Annulohypoxylon maeteangense TaxID=1927788 RepID=UPI002007FB5B|nr:uncharacterized protein GGS22DRAFT_103269 [Annulohypoxylon maeteangense]KAI0879910.1 hypothetical protein GGS22DRAFT_103269 [Annulohypoxylon maeteangense]